MVNRVPITCCAFIAWLFGAMIAILDCRSLGPVEGMDLLQRAITTVLRFFLVVPIYRSCDGSFDGSLKPPPVGIWLRPDRNLEILEGHLSFLIKRT
jgi:hypothetical protein